MEKKEWDFFDAEESSEKQIGEQGESVIEENAGGERISEKMVSEEQDLEESASEEPAIKGSFTGEMIREESILEETIKKEGDREFEKNKKKKRTPFFSRRKKKWMVIGVILFLVFLVIYAFYRGFVFMDAYEECEDAYQECEDAYYSMKQERDYLTVDNASLEKDKEALQKEYDNVLAENEKLKAQNEELENGAATQLVDIKNAYEKKKWDKVISLTDALHEKYNGSAEDTEAQKLKEKAKSEKETEAKKKAEEQKKGYETGITFSNLARDPDKYRGEKVKFTGKVLQTIEDDGIYAARLAVNSDYDTVIYVIYTSDEVSSRILEDDVITIYGISSGLYSYKSTMSGTITIPSVVADKIEQ